METKHKIFKPFDKVLIKLDYDSLIWHADFYSHYDKHSGDHNTVSSWSVEDKDILLYEGNEYLLGTTDNPEEEVKLEKGERIICNDNIELLMDGIGFLTTFVYNDENTFYTGKSTFVNGDYNYAIRFADFNPNDMEETRKYILCVKNGKIVRYKNS